MHDKLVAVPEFFANPFNPLESIKSMTFLDTDDLKAYQDACQLIQTKGSEKDRQNLAELQKNISLVSHDNERKYEQKKHLIVSLFFRVAGIANHIEENIKANLDALNEAPLGHPNLDLFSPPAPKIPETPTSIEAAERVKTHTFETAFLGKTLHEGGFSDYEDAGSSDRSSALRQMEARLRNSGLEWSQLKPGESENHTSLLSQMLPNTFAYFDLFRFYEDHPLATVPGKRPVTNISSTWINSGDIVRLLHDGFMFNSTLAINDLKTSIDPSVYQTKKREFKFAGVESTQFWPRWLNLAKWLQDETFCYRFAHALLRLKANKKATVYLPRTEAVAPTEVQKSFVADVVSILVVSAEQNASPITWQSETTPVSYESSLIIQDVDRITQAPTPIPASQQRVMDLLRECFIDMSDQNQVLERITKFTSQFKGIQIQ